jgi:hypothetical protein
MHPVILQDLANEHVRDMRLTATAARRARRAPRARRGYPALGMGIRHLAREASVRHA